MYGQPRRPSWQFLLLDEHDQVLREMGEVEGGDCTISALGRVGGSGRLRLRYLGDDIDWMKHRVQAIYDPGVAGFDAWPVGTFMLSSPREMYTTAGRGFEVGIQPKLQIPQEDAVAEAYSVAAGSNIVSAARALLLTTGETRIVVTSSDATLTNAMAWDAGTTKREIVNDLLTAANYWSLFVDGSGQFRIEPYVAPESRSVVYRFVQGEAAIHAPQWEREQNRSSVPNRFIVVREGTDDTPAIVGVASNNDPESPYSFQARGNRWIVPEVEHAEVADQSTADALAQRRLHDAMNPVARLDVSYLPIPISVNDVVSFADSGHEVRATVLSQSYQFTPGGLVRGEWREL